MSYCFWQYDMFFSLFFRVKRLSFKKTAYLCSVLIHKAMKIYKILRGLLKASALTTVMFIMQACYGSPYGPADKQIPPEEEMTMQNDSIQPEVVEEVVADMTQEAE